MRVRDGALASPANVCTAVAAPASGTRRRVRRRASGGGVRVKRGLVLELDLGQVSLVYEHAHRLVLYFETIALVYEYAHRLGFELRLRRQGLLFETPMRSDTEHVPVVNVERQVFHVTGGKCMLHGRIG